MSRGETLPRRLDEKGMALRTFRRYGTRSTALRSPTTASCERRNLVGWFQSLVVLQVFFHYHTLLHSPPGGMAYLVELMR